MKQPATMKTKAPIILALTLLLAAVTAQAQETTDPTYKVIQLSETPLSIVAETGFDVTLQRGSEDLVEIYADDIVAVECKVDLRSHSLTISKKLRTKMVSDSDHTYRAVITLRSIDDLQSLKAQTGAVVRLDESFRKAKIRQLQLTSYTGGEIFFIGPQVERLSATAGTGGSMLIQGVQRDLQLKSTAGGTLEYDGEFDLGAIKTSTGSDIRLRGKGDTINVNASLGSTVSAEKLTVKTATLDAALGASIIIRCKEPKRITKSGSGEIIVIDD